MLDYKKIIKSQKVRIKILQLTSFIPDKLMIKIQYRIKTGRKLNLKNPKRFTEKLQWYKLYYRDPIMQDCVDKYKVREYVTKCGYEDILVPLIGIYDSITMEEYKTLPNSFVVKDTLGGGGDSVIVVKDKSDCDVCKLLTEVNGWGKRSKSYKERGREWVYQGKHKIIIESKIGQEQNELIDYKFFCFNGKVEYIYVIFDRKIGSDAKLMILNREYLDTGAYRLDELKPDRIIDKPDNFEKMIKIAEDLSKLFPHARVDLYNDLGCIYFGELTFFDGSGYMCYDPDEFDFEIGEKFVLPEKNLK